ncbi:hypothetical protein RvY_11611 [Ramazzottius varieornatus]|uniref:N-terminal kinase-like protein n=1 Tax=Ramazzottius varieornatus TaxID=947166 RepID=A0A1D1VGN7_RAMVA|nr:hypothetical protein RvY_11611 [Ramazzottius varieornatus]
MSSMFSSIFSRDPTKDFGYELQEQVHSYVGCSFWILHKAVKKGTTEEFSVFVYDTQKQGDSWLNAAKASMKRLKTMRHPNILTYVDGLETDKLVYMVTESAVPVMEYVQKCTKKNDNLLAWGLLHIAKALSFLNETASLAHHNVSVNSVFVSKAGEWKLGGLDYVTPADSDSAPSLRSLKGYLEPPEYTTGGGGRKSGHKWSTDMWGYGVLAYEVYNGTVPSKDALKQINNLPEQLRPHYPSLIALTPKTRPSPSDFIKTCSAGRGFFQNNFIDAMNFLDEIQLKSAEEKSRFFGKLNELIELLPEEMCTYKVLPQLLTTFEFGPGDNTMLPVLLKLGKGLKDDEYQRRVIPVVIKLFSSTDRGTRMQLLQQLRFYIDHLSSNIVNNQIFTHVANGFLDTNPAIREETVKSIVLLAPKLSSKNINEEVMKHFARLQAKDEQGSIRTNTTVCIGKIAPCLSPDVRLKVLVSAFSRALRDPFAPCRISGAVGFAVTVDYFSMADIAARVLPSLCAALTDPEKEVRDQVFKSTKLFVERLEKVSENPGLKDELESKVNAGGVNIINTAANWAGWAVSSITAKFQQVSTKGKGEAGSETGAPTSKPTVNGASEDMTPSRSTSSSPLPPSTKPAAEAGWDDGGLEDWAASLEETTGKSSAASNGAAAASDGWDDADWSSPIDSSAGKKNSSIPVIKPPPVAGATVRPNNAYPFSDLGSDDIFSSSSSSTLSSKPSTQNAYSKPAQSKPAMSPSQSPLSSTSVSSTSVSSAVTKKPATPSTQNASWDSWDSWDTKAEKQKPSSVMKPTPAGAKAPASKSMKLVPKKQEWDNPFG